SCSELRGYGTAADGRRGYDIHDQTQRVHGQQPAHRQDHCHRPPAHQQASVPMIATHALRARQAQTGMTLVEVLVTLVLISVGLLGVAALQLTTLKNNQESYVRSQAAMLAADI